MMLSRWLLPVALASLLLSACTHYEPLSLHGAGSMRVEVEVYKGPVTLSAEAQIGQTAAVMSDFVRAMDQWHDEVAQYLHDDTNSDGGAGQDQLELGDPPGLTDEQMTKWKSDKSTYKNAMRTHDAQWSDYKRRFEHALKSNHQCVFYPQTTGGRRLTQNDWRDCQALLAAYQSSERTIANACYIMHTPGFSALSPAIFLPFSTCNKAKYKAKWTYLYDPTHREKADGTTFTPKGPAVAVEDTVYFNSLSDGVKVCARGSLIITETFGRCQEVIIVAMESFTTALQSTAFRIADSNVRYVPHERNFRGLLASYAYLASEYGNQMSSRVAVLRKELAAREFAAIHPQEARSGDIQPLLPTGDYLRGAGNSDFAHLYEWLKAVDRWQPGQLDTAARVRMADRLSNDYYWEKVNEVYASGQGDVSMAFIKDEIGNWSLKSFSNDPAKLLAAYRSVADATLKTAAKLATRAATGDVSLAAEKLSAAQQAAAFATQLSGGTTAASNGPDIAAMRARVVAHIRAREQAFEKREAGIQADITTANAPLATDPDPAKQQAAQDAQKAALKDAQDKLLALRKDTIAALRDIMEDDGAVLTEMENALAPKASGAGAAPAATQAPQ